MISWKLGNWETNEEIMIKKWRSNYSVLCTTLHERAQRRTIDEVLSYQCFLTNWYLLTNHEFLSNYSTFGHPIVKCSHWDLSVVTYDSDGDSLCVLGSGRVIALEKRLHEEPQSSHHTHQDEDPEKQTVYHHGDVFPVLYDLEPNQQVGAITDMAVKVCDYRQFMLGGHEHGEGLLCVFTIHQFCN